MNVHSIIRSITVWVLSVGVVVSVMSGAKAGQYEETFTTTQYKDAVNTNAWWNTADGEIKLYPLVMTLTGTLGPLTNAAGVTIAGDYAYVADDASGLRVVDISDPSTPSLAGSYNTPNSARDVAIAGDLAYVADFESGLQILDISNPASPTFVGS